MKTRSLRYLAKEGVKNVWVNRLMSISSVGVLVACMVLIGLFLMVSLNVSEIIGNLEKQNVVMVYFDDYNAARYDENRVRPDGTKVTPDNVTDEDYIIHNSAEAEALCEQIRGINNIDIVEYISKEQGLENVKSEILENNAQYFDFLDEDNPLSDAAKVTMKDMAKFNETIEAIKELPGVYSFQSHDDLADKINGIEKGVIIAVVFIIALLLIISLVIVSNTIRVTMYNRKLEIGIMKAVGATDAFVRLPFVFEGVIIGLISAFFAEGVLYCCYRFATEAILSGSGFGEFRLISFGNYAFYILGIFTLIGVCAGALGSSIMIGKYLRKEGSEFAAI